MKPNVVFHADWSTERKKRWGAIATLGEDGRFSAHAPALVDPARILDLLRQDRDKQAAVFAGFDFPIGIPEHYAARAGVTKFRDFLPGLGKEPWAEFNRVCDSPDEISIHRPFYPSTSSKGRSRQDLFRAHSARNMMDLLRQCERGGNGRRQACCLFWTLGGNQVGKAALRGWKEVLTPALLYDHIRLWPFDGQLTDLLRPGHTIIAETYPAEYYRWFPHRALRSKTDIESRKIFGVALLSWAQQHNLLIDGDLKTVIENGFPNGEDDAFDAVVGLFAMLQVCNGERLPQDPRDNAIREIEGWILGR
jgi:hypothetical protein